MAQLFTSLKHTEAVLFPTLIRVRVQTPVYNLYRVSNLHGISKQTEIVFRESFLRNTFCSALGASISEEQVCFEATVVIVIYYREAKKPKVCKHRELEAGRAHNTHTHKHIHHSQHIHMHASSLVLHSFFTPQSVEQCLQGPIFK